MKQFLILILICFAQNLFSQIKTGEIISCCYSDQNIIYDANSVYWLSDVDVKPKFPGGIKAFYHFIEKNYKTPAVVTGVKGKLYITLVVEKDGKLSDIKTIRDLGFGTGKEAIRVLKICPKWIPGKQNGEKVRVLYSIPISIN